MSGERVRPRVADEFDLAPAEPPDDAAVSSRHGRRRSGPVPWVAGALGLVLVGSLTASPLPLVIGQGDGAELNLSDLDLAVAPTVVWDVDATGPSVWFVTDDRVVTSEAVALSSSAEILDLATGRLVWRYPGEVSVCSADVALTCVVDADTPDAVVVAADLGSGATSRTSWPDALGALAVEGGLVVAQRDEDGVGADVVRRDGDGSERWHVDLDGVDPLLLLPPVWMERTGDTVSLNGIVLDLRTGEQTDASPWLDLDGARMDALPDGGVRVTLADGRTVDIGADELPPQHDDDLGGPIQFVADGGDVVARTRDGHVELWRHDTDVCAPHGRAQGVVVLLCVPVSIRDVTMSGFDEVTGERLWTAETTSWPLLMSSTTVVAISRSGELIGVDVPTGRVVWSLPLGSDPDDISAYGPSPDDGLLITTSTSLIRVAWPPADR